MRSRRTQYEVRCLNCDVTFPVETRKCIHCGARTVQGSERSPAPVVFDMETGDSGALRPSPVEAEAEVFSPFSPATQSDENDDPGAGGGGLGRSVLGSMGSLIWIGLLIAFSIFGRACGE